MSGFLNGAIEYRSFLGEDENYAAKYAVYKLSGVLVREIFAVEPEMERDAGVTVYYFPNRSTVKNENGEVCELPRPKYGDLCVLRAGEADECVMRVAESGYFGGVSGNAAHIRLKCR